MTGWERLGLVAVIVLALMGLGAALGFTLGSLR